MKKVLLVLVMGLCLLLILNSCGRDETAGNELTQNKEPDFCLDADFFDVDFNWMYATNTDTMNCLKMIKNLLLALYQQIVGSYYYKISCGLELGLSNTVQSRGSLSSIHLSCTSSAFISKSWELVASWISR